MPANAVVQAQGLSGRHRRQAASHNSDLRLTTFS